MIYEKIVFNGQMPKKFHIYKCVNKNMKKFCGSKYFILREQFKINKKSYPKRTKSIKTILLIFGGSDEKHLTKKIIPYLVSNNFKVIAIVGPNNQDVELIKNLQNFYKNLNVIENPKNISKYLISADMIISASGTTSYELLYLNKSNTILIPTDKEQLIICEELVKIGFGFKLDCHKINKKNIMNMIFHINDSIKNNRNFKRNKILIDGYGVNRICKILIKEKIS